MRFSRLVRPTCCALRSPPTNTITVGTPRMAYLELVAGDSSMSSLPTFTLPSSSVDSFSMMGFKHFAGAAPHCRKVDEDRNVRFEDFFVPVEVVQVNQFVVACHVISNLLGHPSKADV